MGTYNHVLTRVVCSEFTRGHSRVPNDNGRADEVAQTMRPGGFTRKARSIKLGLEP